MQEEQIKQTVTSPGLRFGSAWTVKIAAVALIVVALGALLGVAMLGGQASRRQDQATASAPRVQAPASLNNTPAAAQAPADMRTPSPYVVVKPGDALPNPAASETVPAFVPAPTATNTNTPIPPTPAPATATSVPAPPQAQAPTQPATKAPPTQGKPTPVPPKKASGPLILPNGVRYGDHKPNLPGRIVRIASPNIRLDAPVYEVYVVKNLWEVADYAAGHNYNSKNPGEGGNIVLSGHNNWRGEVFRYLEFLKPGNEIDVWTQDGKEYRYQVQDVRKLQEAGAPMAQRLSNGKVMDPTPREQLTLITCWPYTTYTHRLIVTALPMK